MRINIYQIDAFSAKPLGGNPAAVCPLETWLPDDQLLAIAAENNLAETAFFTKLSTGRYHLRWFTPEVEVELCGHATLATSWAIFEEMKVNSERITFETLGGELSVTRAGDLLSMDFPASWPTKCDPPPNLLPALGISSAEVLEARDYVVVVDTPAEIEALSPDFAALKECTKFGVSVTARGRDVDFVSRWFGPKIGVNEDITTGAAHSWLAPYWAEQLGKNTLTAIQGGSRKGHVGCKVVGERVILSGNAATYMVGTINI